MKSIINHIIFLMSSNNNAPNYMRTTPTGRTKLFTPQIVTQLSDGRTKINYGPGIIGHTNPKTGETTVHDRSTGTTTYIKPK